jgi:hypothetical protein
MAAVISAVAPTTVAESFRMAPVSIRRFPGCGEYHLSRWGILAIYLTW